jgi:hypothetical protein
MVAVGADTRGMRRNAAWLLVAFVAMTSCTSKHSNPGDVIAICGHPVAVGGDYVDLTAKNPPSSGYASAVEGDGAVVRVSGDCQIGGTVGGSQPDAATVTPIVIAQDGRPEVVQVTLGPNQHTVVLVIVDSRGSRRTLTLGDGSPVSSLSK